MFLRVTLTLGLLGIPLVPAFAAKDPFKMQGRVGLGLEGASSEDQEKIFDLRLGFQSRRRDRIKANVELRADEDSRDVGINDAFVDYKNEEKTFRIRAGRGKKIMGWEWLYPVSARLSIHRSSVAGYMEDREFVGRDYFAEFLRIARPAGAIDESADDNNGKKNSDDKDGDKRSDGISPAEGMVSARDRTAASGDAMDSAFMGPWTVVPQDESWRAGIALHYDESGNSAFIASWIPRLNDHLRFGSWIELQRNITPAAPITTVGGMFSILYVLNEHRAALEWYAGMDPFRSEIERDFGSQKTVWASSLRAEYGYLLGKWSPYVMASFVRRDLRTWDDWTFQPLAGLRYFLLSRLDFAIEYRYSNTSVGASRFTVPEHYSAIGLMGRYYF